MKPGILTIDDYGYAIKIVDEIVDNTDKNDIEQKITFFVQEFNGLKKSEFLNHLNSLFLNILLNHLDSRCKEADERSQEARKNLNKINYVS